VRSVRVGERTGAVRAAQRDAVRWLDRHAPDYDSQDDGIAGGIITVADRDVAEVEAFCEQWDMSVRRTGPSDRGWSVLIVEGAALPVRGFTEITALYRD
jgi:hypothetical protein